MNNKLSHSSVSKFQDCNMAWKLHYVDKLRSTTMSAALLFGTAIDKAVEDLVTNKDLQKAKDVFMYLWKSQEINGVLTELQKNPNIVYAANDLDTELLEGDKTVLADEILFDIIAKKKELGFENLSEANKTTYNNINWHIAKKRGELMLEAVYNEILPKLDKVLSTQEKIDLSNDNGDSVVGYVDMVANWDGKGPVVFDFKTSTRPYEMDSVKTSPQLALYVHALESKYNTRKAGFIVLSKAIQKNRKKVCSKCGNVAESGARHKSCNSENTSDAKRCNGDWNETINPKCKVDVIIDTIPEQLENIVLENFDSTTKLISGGVFIRNLSACKKPYGLCQYFSLCHENKMDGLVKV